jgi:aromatic ring-cleaving dioxygenase
MADIVSYHAHVYYDPSTTRTAAELVRARIGERFVVRLGRWHDELVGPHLRSMFQVAFAPELFATLVPWLMLNRLGLSVLVHPNTGAPRADHMTHSLWLGEALPLNADALEISSDPAEDVVVPNTAPRT